MGTCLCLLGPAVASCEEGEGRNSRGTLHVLFVQINLVLGLFVDSIVVLVFIWRCDARWLAACEPLVDEVGRQRIYLDRLHGPHSPSPRLRVLNRSSE